MILATLVLRGGVTVYIAVKPPGTFNTKLYFLIWVILAPSGSRIKNPWAGPVSRHYELLVLGEVVLVALARKQVTDWSASVEIGNLLRPELSMSWWWRDKLLGKVWLLTPGPGAGTQPGPDDSPPPQASEAGLRLAPSQGDWIGSCMQWRTGLPAPSCRV